MYFDSEDEAMDVAQNVMASLVHGDAGWISKYPDPTQHEVARWLSWPEGILLRVFLETTNVK
jgi:hypothetical protein